MVDFFGADIDEDLVKKFTAACYKSEMNPKEIIEYMMERNMLLQQIIVRLERLKELEYNYARDDDEHFIELRDIKNSFYELVIKDLKGEDENLKGIVKSYKKALKMDDNDVLDLMKIMDFETNVHSHR